MTIQDLANDIYHHKGNAALRLDPVVNVKGRALCAVQTTGIEGKRRVIFTDANFYHKQFDLGHLRDEAERDAIRAALVQRVSLLMPVGI